MKRNLIRLLIMSCLLAAGSLNSAAQEKKPLTDEAKTGKPGPGELKVPTDGTFKVLGSKFALGKVVKGAPYSATSTTETIQILSDGNQIIRKNESKLYRDSEGRTRIEQSLGTIGKWTADGEARQLITISDPVAGFIYNLDSRARTATKSVDGRAKMEQAMQEKRRLIEEHKAKNDSASPKVDPEAKKLDAAKMQEAMLSKEGFGAGARRKSESLGKKVIEGLEAEGTRITITIPVGEIGNTLPIEVVDENWYSSELQMVVLSKRRDPRSGETTYRLTNINRSDPDRSLFEVPADYTVSENTTLKLKKRRPPEEE